MLKAIANKNCLIRDEKFQEWVKFSIRIIETFNLNFLERYRYSGRYLLSLML